MTVFQQNFTVNDFLFLWIRFLIFKDKDFAAEGKFREKAKNILKSTNVRLRLFPITCNGERRDLLTWLFNYPLKLCF